MASISVSTNRNNIECIVLTSPCNSFLFISYRLFQSGSFYTSFNTTAVSYTFLDLPVGFSYYVVAEIYTAGPTLCESTTSSTVTLTSYCIPSGENNISLGKLKDFYNLNSFDVLLSGPNDPSTSGSIFGKSSLPTSGSPSKARPNAVSELRNACGGVIPWTNVTPSDYINLRISTLNSYTLTLEVRDNSSNALWGSDSASSSSCSITHRPTGITRTDTDYKFTATVTRSGVLSGTLYLTIFNISTNPWTQVFSNSYTVSGSNSYSVSPTGTVSMNNSYQWFGYLFSGSCQDIS